MEKRITNTGIKFIHSWEPLPAVSVFTIGQTCDHVGTSSGYTPLALYKLKDVKIDTYFAISICASIPRVYAAFV